MSALSSKCHLLQISVEFVVLACFCKPVAQRSAWEHCFCCFPHTHFARGSGGGDLLEDLVRALALLGTLGAATIVILCTQKAGTEKRAVKSLGKQTIILFSLANILIQLIAIWLGDIDNFVYHSKISVLISMGVFYGWADYSVVTRTLNIQCTCLAFIRQNLNWSTIRLFRVSWVIHLLHHVPDCFPNQWQHVGWWLCRFLLNISSVWFSRIRRISVNSLIRIEGSGVHMENLQYHRLEDWKNIFTPSLRMIVAVCSFSSGSSRMTKRTAAIY